MKVAYFDDGENEIVDRKELEALRAIAEAHPKLIAEHQALKGSVDSIMNEQAEKHTRAMHSANSAHTEEIDRMTKLHLDVVRGLSSRLSGEGA